MHNPNVPGADYEAGAVHARRHWQGGQTLVVVAVMLVVLIGFLGLVIDGGNVYAQRRQMQNAADAAALAGARAMALEDHAGVQPAADEYAHMNGATACTVFTTSTTVRAIVTETVETYFIRVLGITNVPVGADATAEILSTASCPVLPLTIKYDLDKFGGFNSTDTYTVWEPNKDEDKDKCGAYDDEFDIPPEWHGWVNLCLNPSAAGCDGASALKCWSCDDCTDYDTLTLNLDLDGDGTVEDGEGVWVPQSTGLVSSVLGEIVHCNFDQPALIPLFDKVCMCNAPATPTPPPTPTPAPTADPSIPPACSEADESLHCGGTTKLWYHIVAFASIVVKSSKKPGGACKPLDIQWKGVVTSLDCEPADASNPTNAWRVHLIE